MIREILFSVLPDVPMTTIGYLSAIIAPMLARPPRQVADREFADMVCTLTEPNTGFGLSMGRIIVAINRFHANMVGYRPDELVGQDVGMIIAGPHAMPPASFRSFDVTFRHKSGVLVPAHAVVIPLITAYTDRLVIVKPR